MLQSMSWLLLAERGFIPVVLTGTRGQVHSEVSHATVYFQRGGSMSRTTWHSLAGLLCFLTSKAEGCHRGAPQAKDLQRKNDRDYVECTWGSPGELVCQVLVQPREEGEPHVLCSFLFCILTSVGISFIICEIRIIVPASWSGWQTWENSLLAVRQQFLCLIALCS